MNANVSEAFSKFFSEKVNNVRTTLKRINQTSNTIDPLNRDKSFDRLPLTEFPSATRRGRRYHPPIIIEIMRLGYSANGSAEAMSTWIVCHLAVHHQPLLGHRCSAFSLQKGTSYTSAKIARYLIWRCKQLSTYLTVTVYLESAWTSGHEPHSSSPRRIPSLRQRSRLTVRPTPPKQPSFVYTTI